MIPLLAAYACAQMAVSVHPAGAVGAVFFVAISLLMSLYPGAQFAIYGAGWFLVLLYLGLAFRPRGPAAGRAL